MNNTAGVLPHLEDLNPSELKALIVSQHKLIVSRDSEIEQLKLLIAKLRRMQFGRSSEKLVELPKGTLRIGGSVLGGQGHFGPKGSN
jgi:hypothetical protein